MVKASPSECEALLGRIRETGLLAVLEAAARPGLLWARGPDAAAFLHGQLSNTVSALAPGEGNATARLTRKGRVLDLLSLHRLPDDGGEAQFLLLCEEERTRALREDLAAFHFTEELELEDRGERYDWILLEGPAAALVLGEAFGPPSGGKEHWLSLAPHSLRGLAGHAPADRTLVFARGTSSAGFLIATPREAEVLPTLLDRLAGPAAARGMIRSAGDELSVLLEILRVEAGRPRSGRDFEPAARLLPEVDPVGRVSSSEKGCYLGQEIVARVRTQGSPPQALRGLVLDGDRELLAALPDPGRAVVNEDGERVGTWASRCYSPTLDSPIAMVYLDRERRVPGRAWRLLDRAGETLGAEVRLLPFHEDSAACDRADRFYDEAVRRFARGEDARVQALLEEALAVDPAHTDAWEAMGVILGRSGRYAEAIASFRRLEAVAPDEPMVHTNLSLYYMKLGKLEEAERHRAQATLKRFGAMAGEAAAEERARAEEAGLKVDAQRRLEMFESVLDIDPSDPLALMGAGKALSELGCLAEAEERLARACAAQRHNSALFALHGRVLEKLSRPVAAASVYRNGIEAASRQGDLMPLKEMENRLLLLGESLASTG